MKRVLITLVIVLTFIPAAISTEFWASKNSNKYHYPTCQWAQRISPKNLVKFSSPEEAVQAGYIPCKVCRPPLTSKSSIEEPTIGLLSMSGKIETKRECVSSKRDFKIQGNTLHNKF